jgi:hypothetical protein
LIPRRRRTDLFFGREIDDRGQNGRDDDPEHLVPIKERDARPRRLCRVVERWPQHRDKLNDEEQVPPAPARAFVSFLIHESPPRVFHPERAFRGSCGKTNRCGGADQREKSAANCAGKPVPLRRGTKPPAFVEATTVKHAGSRLACQPKLQSSEGWSGRWESNPRHSAWEADVLPLNYARNPHFSGFWLRFGSAIIV